MAKGLICSILQSKGCGNCSNNGISSKHKAVVLVGDDIPEVFDEIPEIPAVRIDVKRANGEARVRAIPIDGKDPQKVGWMFGGTFVWTSDSRFPANYPIPLHDRQEAVELNEAMSI